MILSGGNLVTKSSETVLWSGDTSQLDGRFFDLLGRWSSYSQMYRKQLWVKAAVSKIAGAVGRLPLKTYRRGSGGREDARDTPYGQLLALPSKSIDPVTFWKWVESTKDIYGETFLGKRRDAGGRPFELIRLHPVYVRYDAETDVWSYDSGKVRIKDLPRRDFVHFRHFNPDGERGMSPLEPLRATLENEEGARRANSAMWRNGGRPSVMLEHPKLLNDGAAERLILQWADIHGGVDNWAKAAILEEGMKATVLPLNVEELQYIEARKLNREEVCAGYDIPPPALQILDRATFCLPADALVMTDRGSIPIVDVTACDRVWSLVDGALRTRRVVWSGQTGFKPLLTIKTQNRTLHCTDNHPVLVRRAVRTNETPYPNRRRQELHWVSAGQLVVGDIVVTANELPDYGTDECPTRSVSEGFAEFCGLLMGDGNVMAGHTGIAISRASAALYMDHYRQVMREEFRQRNGAIVLQEAERATRFSSVSAARELAALGLAGTAHTKRVPGWVFELTPKLRAAFLRGFLDADGSVDKKGRISFSSCNPTMLRQVRELCIGLGVPVTNLTHRVGTTVMPNGRRTPVDQWAFTCSDPGRNRTIGSHDPRYVERLAAGKPFNPKYYTYETRIGYVLDPPVGCGYAKVVDIASSDEPVSVYDLEVDGAHNFIAEGVVVHNSNITENLRSLYRDTMAPKLGELESTLDMELRDGSMGDGPPDFGDDIYGEFLMDEVLRGAFEARATAYQQSDFMTIAEKRQKENLPFIPGTDRIFLNSASLPLGPDGQLEQPAAAEPPPQLALLPGPPPKSLTADETRTVMGRLSRIKSLDDVDVETLTAGLNGHTDFVLDALARSDTVDAFKALLKE